MTTEKKLGVTQHSYTNIAAHLPEMARLQPNTPAIFIPNPGRDTTEYSEYSFRHLDQESNRMAFALDSVGISRGVRTVLMVTPGFEFFALTFALFKVGAVPVFVDPGMGIKNLKTCLSEAEPRAFIGIPKAHIARLILGWGRHTIKTCLTVGNKLFWGGTTLAKAMKPFPADRPYKTFEPTETDTAAILFTSGSTGVPKGVVYTHQNFVAQVDQLKKVYNITPGEIDIPTFPLFALYAPALGMTSVIPVMDFTRPGSVDPKNIIDPILKFNATTMFGSPALIRRVGDFGKENGIKLPTLKRAISAGAPVPARVLDTFSKMLEGDAEVYTPYGATEALPVCSIGSREILAETQFLTDQGKGVCVGKPVDNIRLEIIKITDEPIQEWDKNLRVNIGEIGEIVVSGPQATGSYFNRKESTALAKISQSDGDGICHRMGDLGYWDSKGRVWFCGRKSHRVITQAETLYTIPCEAIFNTHSKVFRTALVGIGKPGRQRPVICVELEKTVDAADHKAVLSDLKETAQNHDITKQIGLFMIHPEFPVDIRHNAKIFREKLADWVITQKP